MNAENNKLIAEFMGYECEKKYTGCNPSKLDKYLTPFDVRWLAAEWMKFHTSWDWLMPVVEKICKIPFGDESGDLHHLRTFGMVNAETGEYMVRFNRGYLFSSDSLIYATYQSVVDFIEWYNQNQNP